VAVLFNALRFFRTANIGVLRCIIFLVKHERIEMTAGGEKCVLGGKR